MNLLIKTKHKSG